MKTGGLYIAVVGIVIIAFLFFVGATQRNQENEATSTPEITGESEQSVIDDNWVQYSSGSLGFSIEYPEAMELSEPPIGGVNFTYTGPTQTDNTEIFDGINVTITRETIRNRFEDPQEFAESAANDATEHGEITEPLEMVTINDIDGYAFTLEGLGTIRHVILERSSDTVLYITHISPDPNDIGYGEVVDRMLSTLEVE